MYLEFDYSRCGRGPVNPIKDVFVFEISSVPIKIGSFIF